MPNESFKTSFGGILYSWDNRHGKAIILDGKPEAGWPEVLEQPAVLEGCPVAELEQFALVDISTPCRVKLPASLIEIDPEAFWPSHNGPQITAFEADPLNPRYWSENGMLFCRAESTPYRDNNGARLVLAPPMAQTAQLPPYVTEIGPCAFAYIGAARVELPAGLRLVGFHAFAHSALEEIEIPRSVKKLEPAVFEGSALRRASVDCALRSVPSALFKDCQQLEQVVFAGSPRYVHHSAFFDCLALTNVYGLDNVIGIEPYAFLNCASLSCLDLSHLLKLGHAAFNLAGLKDVTLSGALKEVPWSAFSACYGLENLTLQEGISHIEVGAFSCCHGLTQLHLPASLVSLGSGAFDCCTGLRHVYIPSHDLEFGSGVFNVAPPNSAQPLMKHPNLTLHGPAGSTTQQYAALAGYPFEVWEP